MLKSRFLFGVPVSLFVTVFQILAGTPVANAGNRQSTNSKPESSSSEISLRQPPPYSQAIPGSGAASGAPQMDISLLESSLKERILFWANNGKGPFQLQRLVSVNNEDIEVENIDGSERKAIKWAENPSIYLESKEPFPQFNGQIYDRDIAQNLLTVKSKFVHYKEKDRILFLAEDLAGRSYFISDKKAESFHDSRYDAYLGKSVLMADTKNEWHNQKYGLIYYNFVLGGIKLVDSSGNAVWSPKNKSLPEKKFNISSSARDAGYFYPNTNPLVGKEVKDLNDKIGKVIESFSNYLGEKMLWVEFYEQSVNGIRLPIPVNSYIIDPDTLAK